MNAILDTLRALAALFGVALLVAVFFPGQRSTSRSTRRDVGLRSDHLAIPFFNHPPQAWAAP